MEHRSFITVKSIIFWDITSCISWKSTDIAEKIIASIFSVEVQGE
jgi:hypothetical protein